MEARAAPPPDLIEDVRFALDHRRARALELRDALLTPYQTWPEDRLLGAPVELGLLDRPDGLGGYIDRVVSAGGSSRLLDGVRNAGADLDHCAVSYRDKLVASSTVGTWRADVERVHAKIVSALDAAEAWLAAWGGVAKCKTPKLALLEQQELLSTEDLAEVLGIGPDAASRRRISGEFGEVVGKGQRKFVRSSSVREALGLTPPLTEGD